MKTMGRETVITPATRPIGATPAEQIENLIILASRRQGIISRLEKRIKRLEAENANLRAVTR